MCLRRPAPLPASRSPGYAGVTEAEAAGLWPHTQAVRLQAHGDTSEQVAVFRRQCIDRAAVTTGKPQHLAVRRDTTHVRRAAAADVPGHDLVMRREVDDSDAAGATVGHIEPLAVATRVETVRVATGLDEAEALEVSAVDAPDTVVVAICDVEDFAGRVELDVLRTPTRQMQVAHDLQRVQVDLHQLCGELAAGDEVAAVGTEVHVVDAGARHVEPVADGERVRVAEVEMALRLGDDDGPPAVGHEVHVVRVGDGDVRTGATPRAGI